MELLISLLVSVGLISTLKFLSSKKVKFLHRNLIALFLGIGFGLALYYFIGSEGISEMKFYLKTISNSYIRLLKLLIAPIIFISISSTIIHLKHNQNLGKRMSQVVGVFILSVLGAALLAYGTSQFFHFENLIDQQQIASKEISSRYMERIERLEAPSIGKVIYGFTEHIPTSIFGAFTDNNIIGILLISLLVGIAIRRMNKRHPEEIQPLIKGIDGAKRIINSMTMSIIKLTPYGVFTLITVAMATQGPSLFSNFFKFIGVAYLTMGLIYLMHLVILKTSGVSPKQHLTNMLPALITAFSTQSSGATLPVTIQSLEKRNGVDTETANITASMGTTMGMNACGAMWPVFMITLGAGVTNIIAQETIIDLTSFPVILSMLIAVVISSFGIAGLPGTASFAAITAMSIMNFSPEVIGIVLTFVLSVDSVIDMGRTATNVFGASSVATFISRQNKEWNKEVFGLDNDRN